MSNIVIGISSGIAAYKIEDLIIQLKQKGHDIQVIMTQNAVHIISPGKVEELSGNPVYLNLFEKNFTPERILDNRKVDHIEVAKHANLFIVAPATANTVAKLASGLADDFLTTAILATTAPILVCPTMNTNMWFHAATQRNMQMIASYGYELLEPESGSLACGTEGIGRLPDIEVIVNTAEHILARKLLLKGKRVLVTSGGTAESIDDARVLTNRSTGKMGRALAEAAYRYGAEVTLVHARHAECTHLPIEHLSFQTAKELTNCLTDKLKNYDIIFHTAAVSDFTTEQVKGKIDSKKELTLHLRPTVKIINKIKEWNPKIQLIGFKAISYQPVRNEGSPHVMPSNVEESLNTLFTNSKADYIIANDISRPDIGFESDDNEVTIVSKEGNTVPIAKAPKHTIAEEIILSLFTKLVTNA